MPRSKKDDRLDSYNTWLVNDQGIASTTARVYTSCLRTLLSRIPDPCNIESVRDIMLSLREDKPNTYSSTRAAWVRYGEYMRSVEGSEIAPAPSRSDVRRAEKSRQMKRQILTPDERDALRELRAATSMSFADIETTRWSDVELRGFHHSETTLIRDPSAAHQFWSVPTAPLRVFWKRAGVTDNLAVPLIPKVPGGFAPVPRRTLQLEANAYTQEQIQAMLNTPPPAARKPETAPEPEQQEREEPAPKVTLADLMRFDPDAD